jgi:hypothetical protein
MSTDNPAEAPTLSSLVMTMAAAALAYLGHKVLPDSQPVEKNLPLAKQTIDTIEMLRAKTEGNRTPDETKLFDELLYQLRLAYVQAEAADKPVST